MVFQVQVAEGRWRAVNGPQVGRAGARRDRVRRLRYYHIVEIRGALTNAASYHMARVDLSGRQVSAVAPGAAPYQQIVPPVQICQQTFEPGMQCSG
jgi:hypothetical protein